MRQDLQRSTLRGTLRCFSPEDARQPLRSWSLFFFSIFCSFEFSRDRQCYGTRKCPHRLSSDELLRVAVPSQSRVSLHAWRLPRRFKNASELCRRCSTPPHAQHAGPHTYIPALATGTPTEQHTTKTKHAPGAAWRRAATALCVAPVSSLARFFQNWYFIPYQTKGSIDV